MRPSRGAKLCRDSPLEGDETLMFPLEMEGLWEGVPSKKLSQKDFHLSSPPTDRSQPIIIKPKKVQEKKSAKKSSGSSTSTSTCTSSATKSSLDATSLSSCKTIPLEHQRSPTKQIRKNNLKKPPRPHHFARLSAGDLEQLSEDDDESYDIDPEASEEPIVLHPSFAQLKEQEDKIIAERKKHLQEIEVPCSTSPPSDQFLCNPQQKRQVQLLPSNSITTISITPIAIVPSETIPTELPSNDEKTSPPKPLKIKNALALAVKEAKEKKEQEAENFFKNKNSK